MNDFDSVMKRPAAPLCDQAGRYCGGMGNADKEAFLEIALKAGDEHWAEYPWHRSLQEYWERCLKYAATSRDKWHVAVATLPGVYEWRWVLGGQLGEK